MTAVPYCANFNHPRSRCKLRHYSLPFPLTTTPRCQNENFPWTHKALRFRLLQSKNPLAANNIQKLSLLFAIPLSFF